jgi:NADPH-dependent glutamate synthase beta subunit-like oxidoreductase
MKLDKELVLQRRLKLMSDEGIRFVTSTDIGGPSSPSAADLSRDYDAVLLATGATAARDIAVSGRQFTGIYPAMDFLTSYTKSLANGSTPSVSAGGKRVVVIGGGDTGTDCLATAVRQNCSALVNLELLSEPPAARTPENPWPQWPRIYRVEYGHEEAKHKFGADPRSFAVLTKRFLGNAEGHVSGLETIRVEWYKATNGSMQMRELPGTEQIIEADLVLLAMGFTGPEQSLPKGFGCELDPRGNVRAQHGAFVTSRANVFAAGDCRRGQSLVVWAINEGRGAARSIDLYLMGETHLPA